MVNKLLKLKVFKWFDKLFNFLKIIINYKLLSQSIHPDFQNLYYAGVYNITNYYLYDLESQMMSLSREISEVLYSTVFIDIFKD